MFDLEIWGFVIGVVGILLAVYTYIKQRVIKAASFYCSNSILLGGARSILPQEVTIRFQDKTISHLKKLNVVFWNSGNVTIDKGDIVQSHPLVISLAGNVDILKASIVRQTTEANGATVYDYDANTRAIYADFAYLDPGQGLNLEILYQGENPNIGVQGVIKGIPKGFLNMTQTRSRSIGRLLGPFVYNVSIAALVLLPFALMDSLDGWIDMEYIRSIKLYGIPILQAALFVACFVPSIIIGLFLVYIARMWMSKGMPPEDLIV